MKRDQAPVPALDLSNVVDLYIRVSTTEQAEEGYSVGEQEERLRAYCSAYGYIIHAVRSDPGYSGATMERPGLKALVADVKRGSCKKIICWKLDRLSRSQKDTMILLEDVFLENDCHFISLMENFDTSTPFGRCIVGILAAFAQMERENIKARTMMGKQAGLKAGNHYGNAPIGYRYEKDASGSRRLAADPFWSRMIVELYNRIDAGEALADIAESFRGKYGYWKTDRNGTATRLGKLARIPTYCGRNVYGGEAYDGKQEALVSREIWSRVNARLEGNRIERKRQYVKSDGLLSGLLFCGCCGARMAIRQWGKGKNGREKHYICYSVSASNRSMIRDPDCTNRGTGSSYLVEELDALVLDEIKKLSLDRSVFNGLLQEKVSSGGDSEAAFRERLEDLDRQIGRLLNLYQTGIMEIEELQGRLEDLKKARAAAAAGLEMMEKENARPMSPAAAWESLCSLQAVIDDGDPAALYNLVHSLIDKIVVYKKDVTIYWAFC